MEKHVNHIQLRKYFFGKLNYFMHLFEGIKWLWISCNDAELSNSKHVQQSMGSWRVSSVIGVHEVVFNDIRFIHSSVTRYVSVSEQQVSCKMQCAFLLCKEITRTKLQSTTDIQCQHQQYLLSSLKEEARLLSSPLFDNHKKTKGTQTSLPSKFYSCIYKCELCPGFTVYILHVHILLFLKCRPLHTYN